MKNYRAVAGESCGTCFSLEQDDISGEYYCEKDETIGYDPGMNKQFLHICDDHNKLKEKKMNELSKLYFNLKDKDTGVITKVEGAILGKADGDYLVEVLHTVIDGRKARVHRRYRVKDQDVLGIMHPTVMIKTKEKNEKIIKGIICE